jgi:hypothetical protein
MDIDDILRTASMSCPGEWPGKLAGFPNSTVQVVNEQKTSSKNFTVVLTFDKRENILDDFLRRVYNDVCDCSSAFAGFLMGRLCQDGYLGLFLDTITFGEPANRLGDFACKKSVYRRGAYCPALQRADPVDALFSEFACCGSKMVAFETTHSAHLDQIFMAFSNLAKDIDVFREIAKALDFVGISAAAPKIIRVMTVPMGAFPFVVRTMPQDPEFALHDLKQYFDEELRHDNGARFRRHVVIEFIRGLTPDTPERDRFARVVQLLI